MRAVVAWLSWLSGSVKVMVRQLYDNYWILLERTGFRPKRHIVEDNIHEIARRVRWRTAVSQVLTRRDNSRVWSGSD